MGGMKTRTRWRRVTLKAVAVVTLLGIAGVAVAANPFKGFPQGPSGDIPAPPNAPNGTPLPPPKPLDQSTPVPTLRGPAYHASLPFTLPQPSEQPILRWPAHLALSGPLPQGNGPSDLPTGMHLIGITRADTPIVALAVNNQVVTVPLGGTVPGQPWTVTGLQGDTVTLTSAQGRVTLTLANHAAEGQ